jgi:hypothetical protein
LDELKKIEKIGKMLIRAENLVKQVSKFGQNFNPDLKFVKHAPGMVSTKKL